MDAVAEFPRRPFEFVRNGPQMSIVRRDMPWLPQESETVRLKRIGFQGGGEVYLASFTRGKKLIESADQLDEHRSRIANTLFNTLVSDFVRGYSAHVKMLVHARTKRPIYYMSNPGGQRVYFMRFDNLDGVPVIIRIASCDKTKQLEVLSVLTNQSQANIKKFARL